MSNKENEVDISIQQPLTSSAVKQQQQQHTGERNSMSNNNQLATPATNPARRRSNKRSSLNVVLSTLWNLFKQKHAKEAKLFSEYIRQDHRNADAWYKLYSFLFFLYARPDPEYEDNQSRFEFYKTYQLIILHITRQHQIQPQQHINVEQILKSLQLQSDYLLILIGMEKNTNGSELVDIKYVKDELRARYYKSSMQDQAIFYMTYALFTLHTSGGETSKVNSYFTLARNKHAQPESLLDHAEQLYRQGKLMELDLLQYFDRPEPLSPSHLVSPPQQQQSVTSTPMRGSSPPSTAVNTTMNTTMNTNSTSISSNTESQMLNSSHKRKRLSSDFPQQPRKVNKTSYNSTPLRSQSPYLEVDTQRSSAYLETPIVIRDEIHSTPKMTPSRQLLPPPQQQQIQMQPQLQQSQFIHQQQLMVFQVNNQQYKVIDMIGKGGSSKVYRVFAPDQKILALKVVEHQNHDKQTWQLLMNEVQLLSRLKGKANIIELKDYERLKEHLVIVMECGDLDLSAVMRMSKGRSLNSNQIRLYSQQMLEALNTIHENRIVHSDLKPANFLMVRGSLKLIDFGIAKQIKNDTTNIVRDSQIGTVNYIPPEALLYNQAATQNPQKPRYKLGRSSDLWSFGCIVYQMVYGKPPFADLEMLQKLQAITNPSYEIAYPTLPEGMDPNVLQLLKSTLLRDPEKRATIPQLLESEFLRPRVAASMSQNKDLVAVITGITRGMKPNIDASLAERVMKQALDMLEQSEQVENIIKKSLEELDSANKLV
jgi:tRNA A-37 threonylcarbamoyl transferase component Bud32